MARRQSKLAKQIFDAKKILKSLDKATRDGLMKFGSFVRRTAKSSLRMGRMVRLAEMTNEERKNFRIRQAIGKKHGFKAKRRRISADPGNAPKLKYSGSPLRKLIFFSFDKQSKSVVVGPLDFKGQQGASKLEHGKGGYRKFPFMAPALAQHQHLLPSLWKNSIRK